MKKVYYEEIVKRVKDKSIEMNINMDKELKTLLERSIKEEDSSLAKEIMKDILLNQEIAQKEGIPLCQDTGIVVAFVNIGQDLTVYGGNVTDAINEGVSRGYKEGYLRKSIVECPLRRKNTKDNTPAIIYYDIVEGEQLSITLAAKGFGSENMSAVKMLKPSEGIEGVKKFILETIKNAGGNCCPPIVVGVGIGGTFDKAAQISKKALVRDLSDKNKDPYLRELEEELIQEINRLGIGPQGFGGKTTALAVKIETHPTHIAGLPVAVNINCHASRHVKIIL
ncbi:fumarate hydratase [Alkaliphilus pronyensis]|uniref:Fumarate hydratase n=1 Tax=Alkaliphilus pronyensis TaxID=1482732 RepID=A0A6I0F905_9FIRM|nr:fumarate hydratase [Alkaliphilus pronyensis]KAB3532379.1 fumarate hydratase [Alkaliphilus pronyensis]